MHASLVEAAAQTEAWDLAVVMDVLRASTTALTLLDRIEEVAVVGQPESLHELPPRAWLLVSELERAAALGPCIDNSPVIAATIPFEDRTPCLITTNGTRALCAAAVSARTVLMAGFLNLSATVAEIRARKARRVVLLPAGNFATGEPHTEDELCARALEARLRDAVADEPAMIAEIWKDARVRRRLAKETRLQGDIEAALSIDRSPVAAVFVATGPSAGWLRRSKPTVPATQA